ncbi:MAG: hypothetical protein R3E39_23505 [Anaerolineae bacterium]
MARNISHMPSVDKRGKLEEAPFDFQITKDGKILIYWGGKIVTTLSGDAAQKLAPKLDTTDESAIQLALAKATGHFKHGNERRKKS